MKLFEPIKIGSHLIKNRIIMPAMGTNLCNSNGTVSEVLCDYLEERAKGGVGLIVLEITSVAFPQGAMSHNQLQLTEEYVIPGFRNMVERIQPYGCKVIAQIHHAGLKSSKTNSRGEDIVSCVDMDINGKKVHGLTKNEIQDLVTKFGMAALRAKKSGLDGVEIHAGHGYLIDQFLSKKINFRQDEYGGGVEGRSLFLIQIIRKVRELCGNDFLLSVRLGVLDFAEGGNSADDGIAIAKLLDREKIDLLSLTTGIRLHESDNVESQEKPDGSRAFLGDLIKPHVKTPVAVVGKIRTPEMCEDILNKQTADMVCIGRQLICDPFWPVKVYEGRTDEIRTCLNCSEGCFGNLVMNQCGIRCALNPCVGMEGKYREYDLPEASRSGRVLVVGGGPAGMQAAKTAAERGHTVILAEKEGSLGGQVNVAAKPDDKEILDSIVPYFENELQRLGVSVNTHTNVDEKYLDEVGPDYVILATGSIPVIPPVQGIQRAVLGYKVLADPTEKPENKTIVVMGGGNVGCEIAIWLSEKNSVSIVEMGTELSKGQEYTHKARDLRRIKEKKINIFLQTKVVSIEKDYVTVLGTDGETKIIPAEMVVLSAGQKAVKNDFESYLAQHRIPYRLAGDCMQIGNIRRNIRSGFFAGYNINL